MTHHHLTPAPHPHPHDLDRAIEKACVAIGGSREAMSAEHVTDVAVLTSAFLICEALERLCKAIEAVE